MATALEEGTTIRERGRERESEGGRGRNQRGRGWYWRREDDGGGLDSIGAVAWREDDDGGLDSGDAVAWMASIQSMACSTKEGG